MSDNPGIINPHTETLDDLVIGGMKLIQPVQGYRFSLDAVLLAHFPRLNGIAQAVDLCAGHAVIPHLLSFRDPAIKITGIEIQENMFLRARRSIELNHLQHRITLIRGDVKEIKQFLPPEYAQLVTCNPPFWKKNSGKINRNSEEAQARHEILIDIEQIIAAARYVLAPGGKLCIIHISQRLPEILGLFERYKLKVARLRFIHSKSHEKARLFLLEGEKDGSRPGEILPPLIIYEPEGGYSQEILNMYGLQTGDGK